MKSLAYYWIGIPFLFLAAAKNRLRGYTTPTENNGSVESSRKHVDGQFQAWCATLGEGIWEGKRVLELCPGDSLGVGVRALESGAVSYMAVDMFSLVKPENSAAIAKDPATLEKLSYKVDREFCIPEMVGGRKFDLIISCVAFEHHDDPARTIREIGEVTAEGGMTAHIIDFISHSRWIRQKDPNNIYRYPRWLYRLFAFPGQPNRWRPKDYIRAFVENGWSQPRLLRQHKVDPSNHHLRGLSKDFRGVPDMNITDCMVVAHR